MTGKTGTGKSAIVNSITGRQITEEGDTLKPQTTTIECTIKQVGDVQLKVWDSPGLQDGTKNEKDYVREISEKCSQFDLIVYTLRMTQSRILKKDADCRAMQILSQPNALGPNMWHNVIIVLTFANIAESLIADCELDKSDLDVKVQKVFRDDYKSSVLAIRTILLESVGLSQTLAESIPIVLAGYKTAPATLPLYREGICDGKRYHWLSDLWMKALEVTKLNAQPAMIKLNETRMAESQEEYDGRLHSTKTEIAKQLPIIFGAKGAELGKRMYSVFTGVGTKMGTITGASLGHVLSYGILANQGHKNKIISEEEYQQLHQDCVAPQTL